MVNDTMKLICSAAQQLKRSVLRNDAEYMAYYADWQIQRQAFHKRHKGNHRLIWETIQLEDSYGLVRCHEENFLFFLGLQMGLELGKINLFGENAADHDEPG